MSTDSRRLPSLDGLRAIAITLVLFSHAIGTRGFPGVEARGILLVERFVPLGMFGVRIFFVISGYLITQLLLAEHAKTGGISLKKFYLRRTFRIFPAGYFFIAVMVVCWAAGLVPLEHNDVLAAATYTVNYHRQRAWTLGHLWSLSVEEQFYLCWPALLIVLGAARARYVAGAMILLAPVARIVSFMVPSLRHGVGETFPTIADSIAAGCLLAAVRDELWAREKFRALLVSRAFIVVPLLAIGMNALPLRYEATIGETVMNLGIALTVERAVRYPNGVSGRILNWSPLVVIGALSYSLYLWQQPFVDASATGVFVRFPLNIALAGVCAFVSSYLIEQPMLRLRARIERR